VPAKMCKLCERAPHFTLKADSPESDSQTVEKNTERRKVWMAEGEIYAPKLISCKNN